jgi:predicted nucleotidyltransferase
VVLDEVVRRIVAVAKPQKIILFGSAARGQDQSDSDLDILVIKDGAPRRRLAEQIHRSLIGVDWPVDVIVATPQDVERYGHSPALVLESALREGILLYAA